MKTAKRTLITILAVVMLLCCGAMAVSAEETSNVELCNAQGTVGGYATLQEALAAYDSATEYVVLKADVEADITLTQDLYIDLAGYDLSGSVNLNGFRLYGMDSTTREYSDANVGVLKATLTGGAPEAQFKDDTRLGGIYRYMAVSGTMILEGLGDHSRYYTVDFSKKKGFRVQLPAGSYGVTVYADGCKTLEKTVELTADLEETLRAEQSDFADSVKVNSKNASSSLAHFDLSQEHNGRIYASFANKSQGKALYFDGSGTDFVAQVTLRYSTEFGENETYQPDLIGGFTFSDGTTEQHIWACKTGIIYNGWKRINDIFGKTVMLYPEPQPAVFTVAKLGEKVFVYLDDKLVYTANWSDLVPGIAADGQIAVGLSMWADYAADMEFSDYSVNFDHDYVTEFVHSH